jgi:hypothetical protein
VTERQVRDSLRFWQHQVSGVFPIFHLIWLPIAVVFLWGVTDPRYALAWTFGAVAYSAIVFARGWIPWRMPLFEVSRGRRSGEDDNAPFQGFVYRFLQQRRNRFIGALITSTAALTPWLLLALTKLFHAKHFGFGLQGISPYYFIVLGLGDAIGRSMLAMMYWLDETFSRWPEFVHEAESGAA